MMTHDHTDIPGLPDDWLDVFGDMIEMTTGVVQIGYRAWVCLRCHEYFELDPDGDCPRCAMERN